MTKNKTTIDKNPLINRLISNSRLTDACIMSDSFLMQESDPVSTNIPILNVALSGDPQGGLVSGSLQIAGESKRFKTLFGLVLVKAYMQKYPDSILLFYDSEFGTPKSYIDSVGIPIDRIVHAPIMNIEQLKFDLVNQLEKGIERGDRVIIFIDSLGNLASKKEIEDALNENSAADMTRAKSIKSLFRMIIPYLTIKNIPLISIAHTYKQQGVMYPGDIVGGGGGMMYGPHNLWIIGRNQEKDGTELSGFKFTIKIEKSRFVKEKSQFPITVSFDTGINKWSGLLENAIDAGLIIKPSAGFYQLVNTETGEGEGKKFREKETNNGEFWKPLLDNPKFRQYFIDKYQLAVKKMTEED